MNHAPRKPLDSVFHPVGRFVLACLLCACQNQSDLPIEAASLQHELMHRLKVYREIIPGFKAQGTVIFEDSDGIKSVADWHLIAQRDRFFEFALWSEVSNEPVFALRGLKGNLLTVWLHPPGKREATIYHAVLADFEAGGAASDPQLDILQLLLQTLREMDSPGNLKIARVEQYLNGDELMLNIIHQDFESQLRLRRTDAMPVHISASSNGSEAQGCLEISFPGKSEIKATDMSGIPAVSPIHLPTEAHVTLLSCCDRKGIKLRIKLRSIAIGESFLPDLPAGRVLPLKELSRDRLWKQFSHSAEQNRNKSSCRAQ